MQGSDESRKDVSGEHKQQASASPYFLSALVTSLRALSQNKARFSFFYLFYNIYSFAHTFKEIGFHLQENNFYY